MSKNMPKEDVIMWKYRNISEPKICCPGTMRAQPNRYSWNIVESCVKHHNQSASPKHCCV